MMFLRGDANAIRLVRWTLVVGFLAVALAAPASAGVDVGVNVGLGHRNVDVGASAGPAGVALDWDPPALASDLVDVTSAAGGPLSLASTSQTLRAGPAPPPLASPAAQALVGTGAAAGLAALVLARPMLLATLAPLYSRLNRGELLDHPVRRDLLRLIAADPGVNISDIHAQVGLGWGSLLYHLQRLEAQEFIVSHRWGRSRRYFMNQRGLEVRAQGIRALKAPNAHLLASLVTRTPGCTQEELSQHMGLSKSVVSKYAKRLEDASLLQRQVGRNCLRLFPTDTLRELLHTVAPPRAGTASFAHPPLAVAGLAEGLAAEERTALPAHPEPAQAPLAA